MYIVGVSCTDDTKHSILHRIADIVVAGSPTEPFHAVIDNVELHAWYGILVIVAVYIAHCLSLYNL